MARSRRKREALPERRTAFRFPVHGPRSEGTLRCGKSEFAVTVLDESAGGYAVTFVGPTQCRIGDQLELNVSDQWIPVRVAFVEMEDIGVEQITGGVLEGHSRLGLERLPEHLVELRRRKGVRSRFRRPLVMLRKNSLLLAAVVFLSGLALVGFAVMRKLDRAYALNPLKNDDSEARVAPMKKSLNIAPKGSWAASKAAKSAASSVQSTAGIVESPPLAEHVAARARVESSPSAAAEEPPRARQAVITRSAAPAAKSLGKIAAKEIENVADELSGAISSFDESTIRLADPEFLLRQDVAQRLQLTQAQQAWIKRLVVERRTAEGGKDSDGLGLNRRALNRLTSQQRKLLLALEHSLQQNGQ
jgi:hypothetical protein